MEGDGVVLGDGEVGVAVGPTVAEIGAGPDAAVVGGPKRAVRALRDEVVIGVELAAERALRDIDPSVAAVGGADHACGGVLLINAAGEDDVGISARRRRRGRTTLEATGSWAWRFSASS